MIKREELTNPKSCMKRADDDEMTFVLLGRDAAAPSAIRSWVKKRIELGKNLQNDPQILEALACAERMDDERPRRKKQAQPTPSAVAGETRDVIGDQIRKLPVLGTLVSEGKPGSGRFSFEPAPAPPAPPAESREKLAKELEPKAVAFYGEQYGDAPLDRESVLFACRFAACQMTGYKTEEEEIHEGHILGCICADCSGAELTTDND